MFYGAHRSGSVSAADVGGTRRNWEKWRMCGFLFEAAQRRDWRGMVGCFSVRQRTQVTLVWTPPDAFVLVLMPVTDFYYFL